MKIIGHRGSPEVAPENTLASFRAAIAEGADGIEFDIQSSLDRVPVVIHDRSLARTTGKSVNTDDLLLAELRRINVDGGGPIPTLAEVLAITPETVHLDIEVKCVGIEREILDVIGDRPRSTWAISSFDWPVLRALRQLDPEVDLWVLTQEVTAEAIAEAKSIGASTLVASGEYFDAAAVTRLAGEGLNIVAWTVNDPEEARRVRSLGVVGMCTDVPGVIISVLVERETAGT